MDVSNAISVLSLAISLIALVFSILVSLRQTMLMKHSNLLPAFVNLLQEFRSGNYYSQQDFILYRLRYHSVERGYSGLDSDARTQFLLMFDYMSSMAGLVSFGVINIYHVYAIYGYVFRDMWDQMRPFVEKEGELKGRTIGFAIDDLCNKLAKVDHAAMMREIRIE